MVTPSSLAMVITETNSLQDHYRVPTMSPLPLAAIADMHPFPFMRLPIELRLQIYNDYLLDQYSPSPEQIHEKVLSPCWTKPPIEILQVGKAVRAEVLSLLQHQKTICLRVCWQDTSFDGLARSCFRARNTGNAPLAYDRVAHLRIEIYPPHVRRHTDMVYIWRHVQNLCSELQRASCVQHLSVHFMENQYAMWSTAGEPRETLDISYGPGMVPSDVLHIMDLFRLLTNVTKAQIHLPASLTANSKLQERKQDTENDIMRIGSPDEATNKQVVERIQSLIAKSEKWLEVRTGLRSQNKLDNLCKGSKSNRIFSRADFEVFEKIWPHRDSLRDYRQAYEYIREEDWKYDAGDDSDFCY